MLTSTFQHIDGVGERRERDLWQRGCTCWEKALDDDFGLPDETYLKVKAGALESIARLEAFDHTYFREKLNRHLAWRAYNPFKEHACFIDIETTGLWPPHSHVTTVCVHSQKETKTYVRGDNLEELGRDLSKYRYIVSFNGARFDLPFLTSELGLSFDQIHLDLLYPLRSLGYSGGLKKIEKVLGIARDTDGVTGFDAVRLWNAYRHNKTIEVAGKTVSGMSALELLIEYNREDTVNLENLSEMVVGMMKKSMPNIHI